MMTIWTCEHETPLGAVGLEVAEDGALVRLWLPAEVRSAPGAQHVADAARCASVCAALDAYFAGELEVFEVAVRLVGTEFERAVWAELGRLKYGELVSYGELARRLGKPAGAARAVGAAVGKNPVPIVVPCHRVIGSRGEMTGYLGGIAAKEFLLRLERAIL